MDPGSCTNQPQNTPYGLLRVALGCVKVVLAT
jgi:hypothetical protein